MSQRTFQFRLSSSHADPDRATGSLGVEFLSESGACSATSVRWRGVQPLFFLGSGFGRLSIHSNRRFLRNGLSVLCASSRCMGVREGDGAAEETGVTVVPDLGPISRLIG